MLAKLLAVAALLAAPVALYGALCAVNAMHGRTTRPVIAAGFVLEAVGWFASMLSAIDYLAHVPPIIWPHLMFVGLAGLAAGRATIYLANQRQCQCPECPARRRASTQVPPKAPPPPPARVR